MILHGIGVECRAIVEAHILAKVKDPGIGIIGSFPGKGETRDELNLPVMPGEVFVDVADDEAVQGADGVCGVESVYVFGKGDAQDVFAGGADDLAAREEGRCGAASDDGGSGAQGLGEEVAAA